MKSSRKIFNFAIFFSVLGLAYFGSTWLMKHIGLSTTDSDGYHLFWISDEVRPELITKGAYVTFDIHTDLIEKCNPCRVVKRIACDEGEALLAEGGKYTCNQTYLGISKRFSKKGVPVKSLQYDGEIPKGQFFAMGSIIDSYDSRYAEFGLVEKGRVKQIAYPIF